MKTIIYLLLFLFIGANFSACTPDAISEESDRLESTWGETGTDPDGEEHEDEDEDDV